MIHKSKAYQIAIIGIVAAVLSILSPITLPIGVVPISLTTFAILIAVYTLGMKKGTISVLIYILLGLVGLPVFSGFSSGPAKLLGPTGGYIIGYVFMALIAGFFIDRYFDKYYLCFIGMILGTIICYSFGTTWLAYQANMSAKTALAAGVIPFIPGDLLKIITALIVGPQIRKRLIKADLFA
ncbi:MAG: biotin transporter BioY [Clostridiales bacterium]|nr:biotin transporter BioY [Clostridiales bacterium]